MEELQFGQFGLSVVLSVIMGLIFKMLGGKELADTVKTRIMVGVALGLGILAVPYHDLSWTIVNITNCLMDAIVAAAAASGIYSWLHKEQGKDTPVKGVGMIGFLFLLWIPFAGITVMQGCAPALTNQQQAVEEPTEVKIYKALDMSATAYDTAMRSLNELYINGVVSKEAAQKAWDGGEAFYLAQKGAIKALRVYVQTKSAGNEQELNAAIAKAGEALVQFTALVTPFLTRQLVTDLESAQGGLTPSVSKLKGGK